MRRRTLLGNEDVRQQTTERNYANKVEEVPQGRVSAIVFGIPKSGSSFAWQVVSDCMEGLVIKTHGFLDVRREIRVFGTYRDPRDCMVSHFRHHNPNAIMMSRPHVFYHSECLQSPFWALDQYKRRWENFRPIKYEDIIGSPENFQLATGLNPDKIKKSYSDHSIEKNREISESITQTRQDLQIMPNHVHEGTPGTWRRFIPEELHKLATELLYPQLESWGYPCEED